MMWYVIAAMAILCTAALASRRFSRRALPEAYPVAAPALVPAAVVIQAGESPEAQGRIIAAPGAPNTDPPTDRHITPRGTVSIHRRVGRRRTSTAG